MAGVSSAQGATNHAGGRIGLGGDGSINPAAEGLILRRNGSAERLPWRLRDMMTGTVVAAGASGADGVIETIPALNKSRPYRLETQDPHGEYRGNGSYDWIYPK